MRRSLELLRGLGGHKAHSAVVDTSKLRRFVPEVRAVVPLESGLRQSVEWFDSEVSRHEIDQAANQAWDRLAARYLEALGQAVN